MSCAATVGHFDGVHLGHQHVIQSLLRLADEHGLNKTLVLTFDRLPRTLFDPDFHPLILTTIEERKEKLLKLGVDKVEVLHFDMEMASTPARDFMEHTLRDKYGVKLLLLGYDNRFGKRNQGEGLVQYQQYGRELGIEVIGCDEFDVEGIGAVSSSKIRHFIENNEPEKARLCGVTIP